MRLGEYKEAIEKLEKAIKLKPDFADAYLNLGACLIKLGRYKDSIKKSKKVINIKPNYPDAYLN
jgi:tetratricopeptide (TPR) repeat protein